MTMSLPERTNAVIHGRGAIVPLVQADAASTASGSPREGSLELGTIAGAQFGIWELRGGDVYDTEVDEVFVVISGGATIELLDEHRSVEVVAGDVMRLAAGSHTKWTVRDHIRKVYITES